ncbi:MAG: hypothetical protein HY717_11735 [Planctomycetes bacterium]|nr:hypothetical protein [Planctomycetota bacterium]
MNYKYALGVDTNCHAEPNGTTIRYYDEVLDNLDERSLNEPMGICVVQGFCENEGFPIQCVAVDFNRNNNDQEVNLQFDANFDGQKTVLTTSNDWVTLRLFMNQPPPPGGGGSQIVTCLPLQ